MLKKLVLALGLFIFAVLTLLSLALVLVDPHDFDVDLTAWLSQRTGREVRVLGSVRYEFFPWLGLRVTDLVVAQPAGFGEEPFLRVEEARLRVRLLPLVLRQEVELDRIDVLAPHFELRQNADGGNNWDDLVQRLAPAAGDVSIPDLDMQGTRLPVRPFDWRGLYLQQGSAVFRDDLANDVVEVDNLVIRADPGTQFNYHASCSVSSQRLAAVAEISLHGRCIVKLAPLNLLLQNAELYMELEALMAGEIRHGGFSGIADADLRSRRLELKQATLRLAGVRVGGVLLAEKLFQDDYLVQGELSLLECSPETLLGGDEDAQTFCNHLQNIAASTAFTLSSNGLQLTDLQLVMPGADIRGSAKAVIEPEIVLQASLQGEVLNLNALLPEAQGEAEELLPSWLLSWPEDLPSGSLSCSFARLEAGDAVFRDVELRTEAARGELQLHLDRATFMQGSLHAEARTRQGELYTAIDLNDADADALAVLLFGAPHVQGRLSLKAEASSNGATGEDLWRNLRLQADMQLAKAALDFTSPPKLLGASPQPSFRFDSCSAKLAMSAAKTAAAPQRQPFAYTLDASFGQLQPAGLFGAPVRKGRYAELVDGTFNLAGTALIDIAAGEFLGLENTDVSLTYSGPGIHIWPARHWDFQGHGTGRLDLQRDILIITDIEASLPGLPVQGSLTIEHGFLPGPPSHYTGTFIAPSFIPRQVLPYVDIEPPETRQISALSRGALDATYAISDTSMEIEVLELQVDETGISGTVTLEGLDREGPLLHRFELAVDSLDLDDYLPPEAEKGREPAAWSSDWLQDLRLSGGVSIGQLQLLDLRFDAMRATVEAKNGGLWLKPVSSRFYDGEFFGVLGLHTLPRNEGIGVSMECSIADFQLENVIRDLGGGNVVGGTASWDMNLAGGGNSRRRLMQTLSGRADFRVEDGFYRHERDVTPRQPTTRAAQMPGSRKDDANRRPGETKMEFSRGQATFLVQDGQVNNDDFHVQGLIMQAHGSGNASLPARTLDYTILVQMTGAPTIPVHIHGPFANPEVEVSQSQMLTDTVGRLGGSVFGVFKTILTLPFKAVEALQKR